MEGDNGSLTTPHSHPTAGRRNGSPAAPAVRLWGGRVGWWLPWFAGWVVVGCSHQPPANFAPDPGFIQGMRQIRITTSPPRACPGGVITASYEAQLESGLWWSFARRYDKNKPPKLHVIFLRRTSPEATPQEDGDWTTYPDPLLSAMNGFRLTAFMPEYPSVQGFASVEPEYSCMLHAFSFEGEPGAEGGAGANGPDVTVRLRYLKSPFYEKLLVAAVEVGVAPPFFVFGDANFIPPADWLIVESRGGRGGQGTAGVRGRSGANGTAGCPASAGGAGGPGGPGGPGGAGGRGGRITVVVPADEPLLAGLVETRSVGGRGGAGGTGGAGGAGGKGGPAQGAGAQCRAGAEGVQGQKGAAGADGPTGVPGPRGQILTVLRSEVFGAQVPGALQELIAFSEGRR